MGRFFAIVLAIVLHVGFILFGGWFFMKKDEAAKTEEVELVSEDATQAKAKDQKKEETEEKKEKEDEEPAEEIPDAEDVIKSLEVSAAAASPELEAASLSAIEQALSGQGVGGGDASDSLSFASGGRIGGKGRPGSLEEKMDNALNLSEIDQKPRALFNAPPSYPVEMRGKKIEGVVTVIFVVDPAGKVTSPKIEKSSHPAFERPALDAVRQWKFEPGLRGGQRVGCRMRVPIRFQPS